MMMVSLPLITLLVGSVVCRDDLNSAFKADSICSAFDCAAVSEKCCSQLTEACRNGSVLMKMMDATSKFPFTGMHEATKKDLGAYDECISIDHNYDGGQILGKYCLYGMLLPDFTASDPLKMENVYKLSPCMPDACSAEDYNQLFKNMFNNNMPVFFQDAYCSTKEPPPFGTGDIITLIIMSACLCFMVTSTLYDVYLTRYEKKTPHPIYLAFSVLSNGRKLIQTRETATKEIILMFQGLRVLLMMWILAAHAYQGQTSYTVINHQFASTVEDHLFIVYIKGAVLAVESFFFITGFLVAYHYLCFKSRSLKQQICQVPLMIVQRYLRITPAALMIWLVMTYLFIHLGTGPMYTAGSHLLSQPCKDYWFAYFFYFQNYYNYDNLCFIPTWYISADMQMFVFAPLILIPLALYLEKGKFKQCMIGMLIVSIFFTFFPLLIRLQFKDYRNNFDTHSRAISFIIGMIMGAYLREKGNKPFLHNKFSEATASIINIVGWILTLVVSVIVILSYQYTLMYGTRDHLSLYNALSRPTWALCHSWMLYSCYHGYGGIANWFLSLPIFQVLARLTYTMYLCHGLVISHYISRIRTRNYFDDYNEFMLWCGYFIVTCIVSFIWTLAFESPMITISKVIFGKIKGVPKPAQSGVENGGSSSKEV